MTKKFAWVMLFTACSVFAQDAVTKFAEKQYAIKTLTGFYLTAENGGGGTVNSDRTQRGSWETFTMSQVSPGVFTFKTEKGTFLANATGGRQAMRGGGGGGLSANRRQADQAAQFKLILVNPEGTIVAIQTSAGTYVTAENSGGMKGARGPRSVNTNRTEIGEWELFQLEPVN